MNDFDQLLPLWNSLRDAGEEYVLATIVDVEGSGYRKPGARMLIAADGRRAGTISGGCLEAEVARKAIWHTETGTNGTIIRRYSTKAEDGEVPFGMGCGGVVYVLLERSKTAGQLFERLIKAYHERLPIAIATVLDGENAGSRAYWPPEPTENLDAGNHRHLVALAKDCFERQQSFTGEICCADGSASRVYVQWSAARPGLYVFGAGDDALPMVKQARQLGWYVAVADGRSHLATRARFADADDVHVLHRGEFPKLALCPTDVAAVMTHSLEQDTRILTALLKEELTYIGVLGPRRRTADMLATIAESEGVPGWRIAAQTTAWLERLHSPMGLDLGGSTPREIALAAAAEMQQCVHRASGLSLRTIRHQESVLP